MAKAYKEDELISKLSYVFGVQFRIDRAGRLYAVINPAIRDGKYDPSQALEYTESGYDNTEHAKKWIMERLILIDNFIKANNLFDLLTYDIRAIDQNQNYLLVLSPITWEPVVDAARKIWIDLLAIGGLVAGAVILIPRI